MVEAADDHWTFAASCFELPAAMPTMGGGVHRDEAFRSVNSVPPAGYMFIN